MGLGERWGPRGVKGTGFLCASGNLFPLSNFSVSLILLNKNLSSDSCDMQNLESNRKDTDMWVNSHSQCKPSKNETRI